MERHDTPSPGAISWRALERYPGDSYYFLFLYCAVQRASIDTGRIEAAYKLCLRN